MRYSMQRDDDGHEFLVPEGQEKAFESWLNLVYSGEDYPPMEEAVPGIREMVYHRGCYTFENVRVNGESI